MEMWREELQLYQYCTLSSHPISGSVVVLPREMMEAFAGDRPGLCSHRKWPCRYLRPSPGTGT